MKSQAACEELSALSNQLEALSNRFADSEASAALRSVTFLDTSPVDLFCSPSNLRSQILSYISISSEELRMLQDYCMFA